MLNEAKVQKMNAAKQLKKQKGASMIEYAIVVAAVVGIAGAVFGDTGALSAAITKVFTDAATAIGVL
jgi:Flp pilus assembly pilin Flp